ncbi:hypothetical protein [Sphingobacterium spiritivorum]|uniref:hypothetical protein n=1 Tax=Sphingobacterium spiritivorum TaxID=258 RepID=UPI00191B216F|nr:hypothetical protein [Sphingobacterium spiritivorum]QQT26778.1 hypothetical protein I6J02_02640 [Sphingobacterium spiritivorum]
MFIDYQEIIIDRYKEIKEKGDLPNNLVHLTPANLRNECLNVCEHRFIENEDILSSFFGSSISQEAYYKLIWQINIERFQPLINFLNNRTQKTDTKNIELLAWLIDFTPRPYSKWKIESRSNNRENTTDRTETPIDSILLELTPSNQNESERISDNNEIEDSEEKTNYQSEIDPTKEENEQIPDTIATSSSSNIPKTTFFTPPKKTWFKRNIKQTALSLVAATTLCGGTYMVAYNGSQGCMYWTGDHYKSIPCQEKVEGATVLALDSAKLLNFKKINVPDTLTISSLNTLWYTKITVDSAEFYTSSGFHPLFPEKRLKPVTLYILNKYVLNK